MKQSPVERTIFNLRLKAGMMLSSASERADHKLQRLAGKILPEVTMNRLHVTLSPELDDVPYPTIPKHWKEQPEGLPEGWSFSPTFSHDGVAPETELQHDEMAFTKDFLINKQGGVMTGSTIPELTPEEMECHRKWRDEKTVTPKEMERRLKLFVDKVTTRSRPRKVKKED